MEISNTLKTIKSHPNVTEAHILDAKTLYGVIREESLAREWLGMPFYNQAAKVCLESSYVVCVFSNGLFEQHMDGSIVIYDNLGIEIGKMIDHSMKDTYSACVHNIWLAEDFVLFSNRVTECPVAVVMKPIKTDFLKDDPDVESASLFYPGRYTDIMLREHFDVEPGAGCSSAIIGINRKAPEKKHVTARAAILGYY